MQKIKWHEGMNFQATDTDGDVYQFMFHPLPIHYEKTQAIVWYTPFLDSRFIGFGKPISVNESRDSLIARDKE